MKIAGGQTEEGIVIGNTYDKYGSKNPIVTYLVKNFDAALNDLVSSVNPATIHEIGCGEGYWVLKWRKKGIDARGTDFSSRAIEIARTNASAYGVPKSAFQVRNIYNVQEGDDSADLVVCCEVFEHLEDPLKAFEALHRIVNHHLILSVPREPIWRLLNVARGKYLAQLGNTPGHLQHWSESKFVKVVSKYFDVIEVRRPLPWTMLLCEPIQQKL
jgi:2-polyprenyl-3-methyl-5-hydroxy-6-metoxy-1,4-benzoquinol methylase